MPLQGDVPDKGPRTSHETDMPTPSPTPSPTPLQGARLVQQCHVALGNGELDGNTTYQFRVYGVGSDGARGPESEIILVRTRGRSDEGYTWSPSRPWRVRSWWISSRCRRP